MSLIPTIFSSADPGAPQLTGQVGSFLSLVRALLVTGYGTAPNAKAGLGWTEEFTGTNKAVFRGNPISGTGYRLRIDDSNAQHALLCAFDTMSDVDTGTNRTPSVAQVAAGVLWPKSGTANATARAWWAIGNERCFYLFVDVHGFGLAAAAPYFAGDLISLRPGDAHQFMVSQSGLTSYTGTTGSPHSMLFFAQTNAWGGTPGLSTACGWVARNYGQVPGAVLVQAVTPEGGNGGQNPYGGSTWLTTYPFPVNNGLLHSRAVVIEAAYTPRGFMPGVIVPLHYRPFADLTDIPEVAGFPVGTVLVAKGFRTSGQNTTANDGQILFDKSNEW